jgi:hypothetical protein
MRQAGQRARAVQHRMKSGIARNSVARFSPTNEHRSHTSPVIGSDETVSGKTATTAMLCNLCTWQAFRLSPPRLSHQLAGSTPQVPALLKLLTLQMPRCEWPHTMSLPYPVSSATPVFRDLTHSSFNRKTNHHGRQDFRRRGAYLLGHLRPKAPNAHHHRCDYRLPALRL